MSWLDEIRFDARGLVPVIAQDAESGEVLMLAWANRAALEESAATRRGGYSSRSRNRLWRKGEESGNIQELREIRLDCDGDAVIYRVRQIGGIACHTGHGSCFYRTLRGQGADDASWEENAPVVRSPADMYGTQGQ